MAIAPLSPTVDVVLEFSGLLGDSIGSAVTIALGLVVTTVLAELLLRTVGPAIVGPLWFGVFALVCGALLVLATAVVFGYESAPMQWPVFVLLFACSAFVVGATTRMRLTTTQQTSDTGSSADQ